MTPYEIGIMLHYYAVAHDPKHIDMSAPMWMPTIEQLTDAGLIKSNHNQKSLCSYALTDRGAAFVEKGLMQVKLPEWGYEA